MERGGFRQEPSTSTMPPCALHNGETNRKKDTHRGTDTLLLSRAGALSMS
jgi:hypothetical protein